MRIYLNGVEKDLYYSDQLNGTVKSGQHAEIGNSPAGDRSFPGLIDDLRVYDRALNAVEVAQLHAFMPHIPANVVSSSHAWMDFNLDNETLPENGVVNAPVGKITLLNPDAATKPVIVSEGVGNLLWEFHAGEDIKSAPAVGLDGTVYVGSKAKKFFAINGKTGAKIWEFISNDYIESSPAIGENGLVYFGCKNNYVYALDSATGQKVWEYKTGAPVVSSPVIGADGTVYIGSNDKHLYAFAGENGQKKWEFLTSGDIRTAPAIGPDGTIFIASRNGKLYAVNPDNGQQLWMFFTGAYRIESSPVVTADGLVLIGSHADRLQAIHAVNGLKCWEFKANNNFNAPAIVGQDGTIYVGNNSNKIFALNPISGAIIWEFATNGHIKAASALGADGTLYVGSKDETLYALNSSNGQKLWEFDVDGDIEGAPVLSPQGIVYVGTKGNKLYAIQGAAGPMQSAWPMFGRNAQRNAGLGIDTSTLPIEFTYSLASGEGDADNSAFLLAGNELKLIAPADYESQDSYNLRIEATEPDGQKLAKTFSISVSNLDEPPNDLISTMLENEPATIAENNQPWEDTVVKSVVIIEGVDPDHGSAEDFCPYDRQSGLHLRHYGCRRRGTDRIGTNPMAT